MQISSINNNFSQNFKGHFNNSAVLRKVIEDAEIRSLVRFDKIIKRATEINDNKTFNFTRNYFQYLKQEVITLNMIDDKTKEISILDSIKINENGSYKDVLSKFLGVLENLYPKQNHESTKEELMQSIFKALT